MTFSGAFFFADAGLAGHAQVGFVGGGGERLADFVVHDFVVHRVAIALGDDVHGHFAGTEAINFDLARQALEAGVHLVLNDVHGQRQGHLALEFFEGFNSHSHENSPE